MAWSSDWARVWIRVWPTSPSLPRGFWRTCRSGLCRLRREPWPCRWPPWASCRGTTDVLVGGLAASVGPWPPAGRTEDLDWRFSHVDDAEQTGHGSGLSVVESWFGRHGTPCRGTCSPWPSEPVPSDCGCRLTRTDPDLAAGGGADPATSAVALERSAHRALHHVQLGIDEIDLVMVSQDRPGDRAATAMAMDVALERVIDPPELAPAVRAVAGLPLLLKRLGEQDGRHAMLLSGGPDGLARATVFDTARFE